MGSVATGSGVALGELTVAAWVGSKAISAVPEGAPVVPAAWQAVLNARKMIQKKR